MRISGAIVGAGQINDTIVTEKLIWNYQPCEGVSIKEHIRQKKPMQNWTKTPKKIKALRVLCKFAYFLS